MIMVMSSLYEVFNYKTSDEVESCLKRLYELYDDEGLGQPLEEDQTYFDYYSIIDSDSIWFFDSQGQLDYCWKDNLESDLFKPIMNMLKIED